MQTFVERKQKKEGKIAQKYAASILLKLYENVDRLMLYTQPNADLIKYDIHLYTYIYLKKMLLLFF